ncbi:hypothetical protein DLM_0535 [Aquitalea magnusonii]|uniref:Uncharacterized protein n=1 Tax=Aquitalea magnusonii TaxID=332411 RepID=A0A3G9GF87_9NEIS|nr:hypothetical protein DLM_0535 [Aquitalea magnusonii]
MFVLPPCAAGGYGSAVVLGVLPDPLCLPAARDRAAAGVLHDVNGCDRTV